MPFVELIPLTRCRPGGGTFVERGGFKLAVFRFTDPDRVMVIDDECPHAGGSLASGEIDDNIVTCPWHQWEFDLRTGKSTHSDGARVRRYPAEIRNGIVWVELPE